MKRKHTHPRTLSKTEAGRLTVPNTNLIRQGMEVNLWATCLMCGKSFMRVRCNGGIQTRQIYCGSRTNKQGCSYLNEKLQKAEYWRTHPKDKEVKRAIDRASYKRNKKERIAKSVAYAKKKRAAGYVLVRKWVKKEKAI